MSTGDGAGCVGGAQRGGREWRASGGSAGVSGPLRRSLSDPPSCQSPGSSLGSLQSTGYSNRWSKSNTNRHSFGNGKQEKRVAPSVGTRKEWVIELNEIDLRRRLGSGGSGEVWQGVWRGINVAVKILFKQGGHVFGGDNTTATTPRQWAKVEKSFKAEVQTLSSLRHPNIVLFMGACKSHMQVMDSTNAELQYGIVTEFMSGGSLYDHIHKQNWLETASPSLLWTIVKDIALGMVYLHNEGMIHRDLKSRNILTDINWQVKIADFDLSRIRQATLHKNDPSSSLIGTPSWMAPELIQGLQYDEKVDIYSFGMVLFEIMSGEVPFASMYGAEMNHVRIVYDVVKHCARPALPHHMSDAMKYLINRCWAQDPKERPSFADILSFLNEEDAVTKFFVHEKNAHLPCDASVRTLERLSNGLSAELDDILYGQQSRRSSKKSVGSQSHKSSGRTNKGATSSASKIAGWFKRLFKCSRNVDTSEC